MAEKSVAMTLSAIGNHQRLRPARKKSSEFFWPRANRPPSAALPATYPIKITQSRVVNPMVPVSMPPQHESRTTSRGHHWRCAAIVAGFGQWRGWVICPRSPARQTALGTMRISMERICDWQSSSSTGGRLQRKYGDVGLATRPQRADPVVPADRLRRRNGRSVAPPRRAASPAGASGSSRWAGRRQAPRRCRCAGRSKLCRARTRRQRRVPPRSS